MIAPEARGAWSEIERRLRPFVARRVASVADTDDVLQEIFERMQRGIEGLRDGERFGGWVYRIAESVIADAGRARARDRLVPVERVPETSDSESADAVAELQAELGECVALFVARLPSPYRAAITLTELEGLTQRDAADMAGISISGMKSRVQRGREKIREMFDECCRISVDCRGRVVACEPRVLDEVPEDCRGAAEAWAVRGKSKRPRRPVARHSRLLP
jgi:RNA polymerase sigma-70 factor (ECF subfamily)